MIGTDRPGRPGSALLFELRSIRFDEEILDHFFVGGVGQLGRSHRPLRSRQLISSDIAERPDHVVPDVEGDFTYRKSPPARRQAPLAIDRW